MKIEKYNTKIEVLNTQKQNLEKELTELRNDKLKAEREKRMSELADLMDKKGYTIEDLEKLMTMPKPEIAE